MVISGSFCLGLALMLILLPFEWCISCMIAAGFHELCHYMAVRFLSGKPGAIQLFSYAARMPLPEMSAGREVVCALAGPLGGLCLLLLVGWFPRLSLCAAIQSLYNLLPVYPLDGGRALRCGLLILLPTDVAERFCRIVEFLCIFLAFAVAVYGCIWLKLGIFPLLMALLLLIRIK